MEISLSRKELDIANRVLEHLIKKFLISNDFKFRSEYSFDVTTTIIRKILTGDT